MGTTTNFSWEYPDVGLDADTWGGIQNTLFQAIDTELNRIDNATAGKLLVSNNLSDLANAGTARTNLGLVIGTNVQAYDAGLLSIAGLTTTADRMIYTTAPDTYAATPLTAFGRSLMDDPSASSARSTLGLGSSATVNIGTSGAAVPLCNGANTWSGAQGFANVTVSGAFDYKNDRVMRVDSGTAENSGRVSFGTAAPGTLAVGEIYLQHEA